MEYGQTGPHYYLVLLNQNFLAPINIDFDVSTAASRISTELEVAIGKKIFAIIQYFIYPIIYNQSGDDSLQL